MINYQIACEKPPTPLASGIKTQEDFWSIIASFSKNEIIFITESYMDKDFYGFILDKYRGDGHISFSCQIWAPIADPKASFGQITYLQSFYSLPFLAAPPQKMPTGRAAALNFVYVIHQKGFKNCFGIVDRDLIDASNVFGKPQWENGQFEKRNDVIQTWIEENPNICFETECCDMETSILSGNPAVVRPLIGDLKAGLSTSGQLFEPAYISALTNSCLLGKFRFLQSRMMRESKLHGLGTCCLAFFNRLKEDNNEFFAYVERAQRSLSFEELCSQAGVSGDEAPANTEIQKIFQEQFFTCFPSISPESNASSWDDHRTAWAAGVVSENKVDYGIKDYWRYCNGHTVLKLIASYLGAPYLEDAEITRDLIKRFKKNKNSWEPASLGKTFRWLYEATGKIESSLSK
jgi:hypothetical protein